MSRQLIRGLYVSMLRLAKKFDAHPSAKFLIFRPSLEQKDYTNPSIMHFTLILDGILNNRKFFPLSQLDVSFRKVLQQEFSVNLSGGISISDRIDAGFLALRKFSNVWSKYEATCLVDGSPQSTVVPKSNVMHKPIPVQLASTLAPGVVLCAHPMIFGSKQRSLILLLEHTADRSYGIVINKYFGTKLKDGVYNIPSNIEKAFSECSLFSGGDMRRLQFLYTYPDCDGIPVPGCETPMFFGRGLKQVMHVVKSDKHHSDNVTFFAGFCLWTNGALEQEVQEGYWLPVNAPADRIIQHAKDECRAAIELENEKSKEKEGDDNSSIDNFNEEENDDEIKNFLEGDNSTWSYLLQCLNSSGGTTFATLPATLNAFNVEPVSTD